jgi:serine/threonine protein kinase
LQEVADGLKACGPFDLVTLVATSVETEVWLAQREGNAAVVKRARPGAAEKAQRRIRKEGEALAAVHHSNVVRLLESGIQTDLPWLGLDYLAGEDALSLLRLAQQRRLRVPVSVAARIAVDVARGLHVLHESCRLVHGDVAPANMMVTYSGTGVLIDLGAVREEGSTTAGRIAGRIAFLAPEVLRGEPADRRADVFALGLAFYEIVAGRRLPASDRVDDVVGSELTSTHGIDISVPLKRALATRAADRFASAAQFATAFEPQAASANDLKTWIANLVDPIRLEARSHPLLAIR